MSQLIKHDYKGSAISQREKDNYVNLTQMCKAGEKLVADYLRLDSTNEYLSALSVETGIPITSEDKTLGLVEVKKGGNQTQGTWAHPEVAIDCARWVNVDLRIWANRTLVQIINGQHAQAQPQVPAAQTKALPCPDLTPRMKIVRAIDQHVFLFKGSSHKLIWMAVYSHLKYTYHYDVAARLKNSGIKRSKLDQIEADNKLAELRSAAEVVLATEVL